MGDSRFEALTARALDGLDAKGAWAIFLRNQVYATLAVADRLDRLCDLLRDRRCVPPTRCPC